MKVTAIIAEYNPLHNGHVFHINRAIEETKADHIIAIMSGNHVQRGCPAVFSKYERAKAALLGGISLVIELPLYYSTGSLEYFSTGAVSLIQKLGMVDCISFGSECGDIGQLLEAAECLDGSEQADNPETRQLLMAGNSYSYAVNSRDDIPAHIKDLLQTPNNLLAVAYIRAAKKLGLKCEFHTAKRLRSDYHDRSAGALSSTSIRQELLNASLFTQGMNIPVLSEDPLGSDFGFYASMESRMPHDVLSSLTDYLKQHPVMSENDYSLLLFYRLHELLSAGNTMDMNRGHISSDPADVRLLSLTDYLDVSINLAGKIAGKYAHAPSFSGLCTELKSKDLNYSRISRSLLHILLGIRSGHMREYTGSGWNYYIKPLGFRKDAAELMHQLKHNALIPVISKNADHETVIRAFYGCGSKKENFSNNDISQSDLAVRMFREGIYADDIYEKTACSKCRQSFISEYEHTMVVSG
jgi:predicted nucleotidyltransferase